tara:strand:- start:1752 stop:2570 length:819 start_codon:yes stop_codon:yes gene_type:complete
MKHNKKRNTAFLYECLLKELTKIIVRKQANDKERVVSIIKENFSKGKILYHDLQLYRSILENNDKMTLDFSKRFLIETQIDFKKINRKSVFNAQTKLISQINQSLGSNVFKNFVPNYKNIATVGTWLNSDALNAKSRLIIETKVLQILAPQNSQMKEMRHIDNLTYQTFIKKFNETYKRSLGDNQKALLTNYIVSFSDNGLGLKSFMNEEISRIKDSLQDILKKDNLSEEYKDNTQKVLQKLESFKKEPINEVMVKSLFYIQDLVEEMNNGN